MKHFTFFLMIVAFVSIASQSSPAQSPKPKKAKAAKHAVVHMKVTSTSFAQGKAIPKTYSCQGENMSPQISWSMPKGGAAPAGTKSFALVCEDPDAPHGTFIHWVIYNIPSSADRLAENVPNIATLPNGTKQGMNGASKVGYTGPCPPAGKVHHYHFRLFALDEALSLAGDVNRDLLLSAIRGHILAQGELVGTYKRM